MKKNIFIMILVIALVAFTGCQNKGNTSQNNIPNDATQNGNTQDNDDLLESDDTEDTDNNTDNNTNNNTDSNTEVENNESTNTEDGVEQTNSSELFSIIQKIYEIKNPELALGDIPVDLSNMDSVKYYTGLSDVSKVKDIAVSEAMIGSQAYSLVLVQLNQAKDAEVVANEMLNGIDQRKWICVEADDLQVVAQDDLIMLFMVSSELKDTVTSQEIVDAYKEVRGGKLDFVSEK